MRALSLGFLLVGCSVSNVQTSPGEIPLPEGTEGLLDPDISRFARGAASPDFGFGVVADPTLDDVRVPRMWASMGDRLCAFEGDHGQLQEDVWVDDTPSPVEVDVIDADPDGFVLLTPTHVVVTDQEGSTVRRFGQPDPVVAGERLEDGTLALLVDRGGSCQLTVGEGHLPIHDGPCSLDADVEEAADALYISTGGRTWLHQDGAIELFAHADQVAVDPVSGRVFTGTTGEHSITSWISNSFVQIELEGPLVDFAARGGHAVALTESPELIRIDAATSQVVDRELYVGRMDRERVLLGDNGQGVLLLGAGEVQFYRVRTDDHMRL